MCFKKNLTPFRQGQSLATGGWIKSCHILETWNKNYDAFIKSPVLYKVGF